MKKINIVAIVGLCLFLVICLHKRTRNFIYESSSFVCALVKDPTHIGAVLPSSPFLAQAIVKNIEKKDFPMHILEVGAGTGVFTEKIVEKMGDRDVLDVIELDAHLCEILREKFEPYKNVFIHCLSVTDFEANYLYDFIISGLPFNAFSSDFVHSIIEKYKCLIKPNGIISYFEYFGTANIRKFFSTDEKKVDVIKNMNTLQIFRNEFLIEKDYVFLNIPPAYAYHLKIKK